MSQYAPRADFGPLDALVPVHRHGEVVAMAIVSASDLPLVVGFRWHLHKHGYAYAHAILMHRLILGLEKGNPLHGDHINHNPLDNRRSNLRSVEPFQNMQNRRGAQADSQTGVRNVYLSQAGRFVAEIKLRRKKIHIGSFGTVEEAASAASAKRKELGFLDSTPAPAAESEAA